LAKKFLNLFKNKIIYNFMIFGAKKDGQNKIFPPSSFGAIVGSGIRGGLKLGSKIRDKHPGSATLIISLVVDD
jgi:hypothetical protein